MHNLDTSSKKSYLTRKSIIDAAKIFFSEKGYDGTSFRTLATKAEVNHAVISYHFGNKEKLWLVVVQELFEEFLEDCGYLITVDFNVHQDKKAIFRKCVESLVKFNAKKPYLIKIAFRESMSANKLVEKTERILDKYIELSKNLLTKFQDVGIMSNISLENFHFIFLSAISNRFMIPYLNHRMNILDPYAEEIIREHTDSIVKLFMPEP